ncbi:hypothetical protein ACKU27_05105 [Sphingobium yanoikuyae]|uniref:hypothetical protein n=1 Tax=Sphingobium yanoikuyae TaxID=13690 RepID=UPI003B9008FE
MWYSNGTVSVTNGQKLVTGAGTDFVSNVLAGQGFVGPDGKPIEIEQVVSATQIMLRTAYLGASQSGAIYAIFPTQSVMKDVADGVASLIQSFASVRDGIGAGLVDDGTAALPGLRFGADQDTGFYRTGNNSIGFSTGGVERWRINATGILTVSQGAASDIRAVLARGVSDPNFELITRNGGAGSADGTEQARVGLRYSTSDAWLSGLRFLRGATATDGTMCFDTAGTETMRLLSEGSIMMGATATAANFDGKLNISGRMHIRTTGVTQALWNTDTTGDNVWAQFGSEGTFTLRGSIQFNRSGGMVSYNTTSDYRAKDVLGPIEDSGALIDALNPIMGKMKGATMARPMFIAHEVQEVAPYAVTGQKDAEDADGFAIMQQMDASALIPLLVAELKALRERASAHEAHLSLIAAELVEAKDRITALEAS